MKIVVGNFNRVLVEEIFNYLDVFLVKCQVWCFVDQEIFVEIQENVCGEDVFVVQLISYLVNDYLMELLIIIDVLWCLLV